MAQITSNADDGEKQTHKTLTNEMSVSYPYVCSSNVVLPDLIAHVTVVLDNPGSIQTKIHLDSRVDARVLFLGHPLATL